MAERTNSQKLSPDRQVQAGAYSFAHMHTNRQVCYLKRLIRYVFTYVKGKCDTINDIAHLQKLFILNNDLRSMKY